MKRYRKLRKTAVKRLLFLILFCILTTQSFGQVYAQFERFSNDTIFNSEEIKKQKIKSVCILDTISNLEVPELDTIFIYEFNSDGKAIREIGFRYNVRDFEFDLRK